MMLPPMATAAWRLNISSVGANVSLLKKPAYRFHCARPNCRHHSALACKLH